MNSTATPNQAIPFDATPYAHAPATSNPPTVVNAVPQPVQPAPHVQQAAPHPATVQPAVTTPALPSAAPATDTDVAPEVTAPAFSVKENEAFIKSEEEVKAKAATVDTLEKLAGSLKYILEQNGMKDFLKEGAVSKAWLACYYSASTRMFGLINKNDMDIIVDADTFMSSTIDNVFGPLVDNEKYYAFVDGLETKVDKKNAATVRSSVYRTFAQCVKENRLAKTVTMETDLFCDKPALRYEAGAVEMVFPVRPLHKDGLVANEAYVRDYKEHFPELDELLRFLVYARCLADRREASIWFHAPSDWGKGFFTGVLEKLGIYAELDVHEVGKMLVGAPVGKSPNAFLHAWVVGFDEFKFASADLKRLNSKLTLSPKHQMEATVQLFTKLYLSAETVESLVADGVEAQFNNRISYLRPSNEGKLTSRKVFNEAGPSRYLSAVAQYAAHVIDSWARHMRRIGRQAAEQEALAFIKDYHAAHKLSDRFGELEDGQQQHVEQLRELCSVIAHQKSGDGDFAHSYSSNALRQYPTPLVQAISSHVRPVYFRNADGLWYHGVQVKNPSSVVKSYLNHTLDKALAAKLRYKAPELVRKLNEFPEANCDKSGNYVYYVKPLQADRHARDNGIVFSPRHNGEVWPYEQQQ